MTYAVVGTLSTNNQSNKQKETKNHTQFRHDVLRDNRYGNGFWFIESEVQIGFQGTEKKKHVIVVSEDTKSIKKRQKIIQARNFHIISALNLITYVYLFISST